MIIKFKANDKASAQELVSCINKNTKHIAGSEKGTFFKLNAKIPTEFWQVKVSILELWRITSVAYLYAPRRR